MALNSTYSHIFVLLDSVTALIFQLPNVFERTCVILSNEKRKPFHLNKLALWVSVLQQMDQFKESKMANMGLTPGGFSLVQSCNGMGGKSSSSQQGWAPNNWIHWRCKGANCMGLYHEVTTVTTLHPQISQLLTLIRRCESSQTSSRWKMRQNRFPQVRKGTCFRASWFQSSWPDNSPVSQNSFK